MMESRLTCFVLAVAAAAPALAQAPKCTGAAPALPPELAAWTQRTPIGAATDPAGLAKARIVPGKGVDAKLAAGTTVRFTDSKDRATQVGDNAGLFAFDVAAPGTYRVALGSGGWVDVMEDGKPVDSPSHGHGPDCSGIVKMVDFPLKAGPHVLQIEGSKEASVGILIAKLP